MAVQTQIQTRRGTAASWTSTNPTLAAGEIGFESDTNKFKIGTGSTAWASLAYASNVSPLTTKGDLYTYSTDNTRLAVGANGETIVADSSTSTGLRYQGNYAAGKNLIINGDFGIWQRGTTFTNPSFSDYLCDRFRMVNYNTAPTSATISRQTFTPGSAPVAGYEGQYFFRSTITTVGSTTQYDYGQYIEDFRAVAGRTITVSFWAKSDSSRSQSMYAGYNNITGIAGVSGSPFSFTTTTSWQRFSFTFTPSSLSGATISANANFYIFVRQACASGSVFDWWGVQVEVGNTATAFQTATGTIQGELAACQRYYWRQSGKASDYSVVGNGLASSTTIFKMQIKNPISMRVAPTSIDWSGVFGWDGASLLAFSSAVLEYANETYANITASGTGLTQFRPYALLLSYPSQFIGFSAEL
jgi:hypothetical protein